jgi:hypothetical protein
LPRRGGPIADCRLKKWCGNFLPCQSVPLRGMNRDRQFQFAVLLLVIFFAAGQDFPSEESFSPPLLEFEI